METIKCLKCDGNGQRWYMGHNDGDYLECHYCKGKGYIPMKKKWRVLGMKECYFEQFVEADTVEDAMDEAYSKNEWTMYAESESMNVDDAIEVKDGT